MLRNYQQVDEEKENQYFLPVSELYEGYIEYVLKKEDALKPLNNLIFGKYVSYLFPDVSVVKRRFVRYGKRIYYYSGLKFSPIENLPLHCSTEYLKLKFNIIIVSLNLNDEYIHMVFPKIYCDKTVYIDMSVDHGTIKLVYDGTQLDLKTLQFPDVIEMDYQGIVALGLFVNRINICLGEQFDGPPAGKVSTEIVDGRKIVRSSRCHKVVHLIATVTSCEKCREAVGHCKRMVSII